jgi:hypothetical protein
MDQQVVLGEFVDVLPCALLRQTGHLVAVPSHLPTAGVP